MKCSGCGRKLNQAIEVTLSDGLVPLGGTDGEHVLEVEGTSEEIGIIVAYLCPFCRTEIYPKMEKEIDAEAVRKAIAFLDKQGISIRNRSFEK